MIPEQEAVERMFSRQPLRSAVRDWLITAGLLLLGYVLSNLLLLADPGGGFVSMIFVLMVVLTARLTTGYACGVAASFVGVICVNYVFTYPYWEFNFTISGYPLTFLTMLSVSLIVSALTSQNKRQEHLRMENERETMRANLLRAVSHDLRTPLTSIVGSTSAILENDALLDTEQRTALLRNVRDEAQWLVRMVENLLSITRMSGGDTQILNKELEAAEEALASVADKFRQRFDGIALSLAVPREPLFVPMDAILIEQVLLNLLENAACHGRCSQIELSVERQSAAAVFTVRDNGVGIAEEVLPSIFSPALRSRTADNRRNMGIGLSVCSSIVKAHGGAMSAANAPEGGAVFCFTLPIEAYTSEDYDYED
jgi:two-component system sensor histidine kinase KdpD